MGGGGGGLIGTVGGMLGAGGGAGGTGFSGPEMANLKDATSVKDVNAAEKQVRNSAAAQKNLLQALQAQNGLGMQTNVMNQQQSLANQLQAANGVGTQNAAIAGLQNTAGMYGNIAAGQGPNPAQAMLNQQTGINAANQAALMAGQRGAGANAGLLARQAAQQGGALQQQAVGQGATMQANQQLNALQGLASTQQAFGNMGGTQVGQLQAQQGAMANQANQIAGQQMAQTNQNMASNLANQSAQQAALGNYNSALAGSQSSVNAANAGMANTRMGQQGGVIGGLAGGAASAIGLAAGGEVRMAGGGYADLATQGPQSDFGLGLLQSVRGPSIELANSSGVASPGLQEGLSSLAGGLAKKGLSEMNKKTNDQSMVGPDMAPAQTMSPADPVGNPMGTPTGAPVAPMVAAEGGLAESGGHVEAPTEHQEAVKPGDSYANDKIPAKLSEGEIVLPRSVTMSENPEQAAAEFVKKTLAEKSSPKENFQSGGELIAEAPIQDLPSAAIPQVAPQAPVAAPNIEQVPQGQQAASAATVQPQIDPDISEILKQEQDLASGAITPKTYSDLYAKKDTLGKIGTVFGLMLGGMGSGLTGQPNALLNMMDKEIQRDLEAQKQTKDKAMNFIRLQSENRARGAQTAAQQIENVASKIGVQQKAGEVGAGLDFVMRSSPLAKKMVEQSQMDIDNIMDEGKAAASLYLTAGHDVLMKAQKSGNPQAIALGQQVMAGAKEKAIQSVQQAKAKAAVIGAKKDAEIQKAYQAIAPVDETKFKGAMVSVLKNNQAEAAAEKAALEQNRKNMMMADDAFRKLAAMPGAGEAPGVGKVAALGVGLLGKMFGGGTGEAGVESEVKNAVERERTTQLEALKSALKGKMTEDQIKAMMPSIYDNEKSREEAYSKLMMAFQNDPAELAPTLKRWDLVRPIKVPPFKEVAKKNAKDEEMLLKELKGQAEQAKKEGKAKKKESYWDRVKNAPKELP